MKGTTWLRNAQVTVTVYGDKGYWWSGSTFNDGTFGPSSQIPVGTTIYTATVQGYDVGQLIFTGLPVGGSFRCQQSDIDVSLKPVATPSPSPSPSPTPVVTPVTTKSSVSRPTTSISDGHPEYPGSYLGVMTMPNGVKLPVYQAVLNKGTVVLAGSGIVYWKGYFFSHLIQPKGWTSLPSGGTIKWVKTDGSIEIFRIGGTQKLNGYDGHFEGLPEGSFKFVTCFVDYSRSTKGHSVFGGNVVASLN